MIADVALRAVALAGAAVGLDDPQRARGRPRPWQPARLAGCREAEVTPVPVGRPVVAQCPEVLPCDIPLHLHVAAVGLVQISRDDVEGTLRVPWVDDHEALSRLCSQPYHLLK